MPLAFQENIELTTLPNGVRVVSETVPYVQSVSIGIWVGAGSRDEAAPVRGITHFIEHMLFKGTERRTAREIADEIESRGGSLNAFTDKEFTCYYVRALAEDAGLVLDVLSDMLCHSLLDPEELARERNVVLEEIKRYKDQPEDHVHDLFAEVLWKKHVLGRSIIGTARTVASLEREHLASYLQTHYTPDRIVVSASGNVTHAAMVELASKFLGHLAGTTLARKTAEPVASGETKLVRKRTEQVHFCYGGNGFGQHDPKRYALTILDMAMGGNMSSRLFQEIREKRGLAYSIGSYNMSYVDGGSFAVYGGTSPDTFQEVIDLTNAEFDRVKRESLSVDEIEKAKTQIRGAMVLGLENMSSRMMRMGKSLLYWGRVLSLNEVMEKIMAVSQDDIGSIANALYTPETMTMTAIGPIKRAE